MNMAPVDWAILVAVYVALVSGVVLTKRYMRSVADFLAAGRTAGRYVISMAQGIAMLGAITIVAQLEMNFEAGFAMGWWELTMAVVLLVVAASGWVIYRFRQTRCLTLPEFFERRYSRSFRVFAGLIAFGAGIVNFGIFPAVGARFFIYFLGLPLDTFPWIMGILLLTSLYFVFTGGQIAIIVTDFLQGMFVNIVFVVMVVYLMIQVDWSQVTTALATASEGKSKVNPYETGQVENFNFWYFLIGVVGVIYNRMAWQGTQAYNTSAKSAHEAKMGGMLDMWRSLPQKLMFVCIPIIAFTVIKHVDFAAEAADVNAVVQGVDSETIRNQIRVPVVLTELLPVGLLGAFAAVMLAAFISTHDTYLHSWGSMFIQDVVMPFRKEPFTQREHLRLLRVSIVGVAVFIFFFSLLFQQSQHIMLFFAVTGAIFAGGAGAVMIGGLYWRRGTTLAAWLAMIVGSTLAVSGVVYGQIYKDFFINGQVMWAISMGCSTVTYIVVSLVQNRRADLDRVLHRGEFDVAHETEVVEARPGLGWRIFGMGREFTRADKAIYIATYVWTFLWMAVFVGGTIYGWSAPDSTWTDYWWTFLWIQIVVSTLVIFWFGVGGVRDIRAMLRRLAVMDRDEADDGMVRRDEAEPA